MKIRTKIKTNTWEGDKRMLAHNLVTFVPKHSKKYNPKELSHNS